MEKTQLKPILEALIFASEEPISAAGLGLVLQEAAVNREEIEVALQELVQEYNDNDGKGLLLREVSGGYQFVTKPGLASWIQKLTISKPRSLSQAALETMAILAYRQPIVRSELEAIRGVDSGAVLKTLLERGLIKILGRREEAGQPLIYGTTPAFLELFHLNTLEELPSMKEIEQLVENQQTEANKANEQEEIADVEWTDQEIQAGSSLSFLDENAADEGQALTDLETSIQSLKRLEKEIFPKEASPETPETTQEESPVSPLDPATEPEL